MHTLALCLLATLTPIVPSSVDTAVHEYLEATGLPGAAVAVTHGKQVVRIAGYGRTATGEPVTEHTALPVASVSKSITAYAVMRLVREGRVNLDGPVRASLPEFEMADPRAASITVRQLLNQTSGLSDRTFAAFSGPQPRTLQERVAQLRTAGLAADPGAEFEYHNPNYQVAARLVEVVSGRPFDSYLRDNVFGPLGMPDSRTVDTAADLPGTVGHITIAGLPVAVPEPPAFGNGSGGVLSSAHDMAAWLIAQTEPGMEEMHTPAKGSYALGWSVGRTESGARIIKHSGDLFTATAYQALLPDSGYGIAVMTNTGVTAGDAVALAGRLIALLENRSVPLPNVFLPRAVDLGLLLAAAGTVALTVRGVRRRSRWIYLLSLPLVLLPSIHWVVGWLYRGRDVAWIQVAYLYPAFMIWLVVASLCGIAGLLLRMTTGSSRNLRKRRPTRSPQHTS
ncbi:beta-lactamase family protein [Lentzea tibetensis]|uniref:Beta-lactamase family protein n=1 Tax=Lentzea tibetensis TaxID=2591470 RepID=A0A563EP87_9PSEU|nr:serine hydrolase domain-containing protein [Lentzea tibetensis]TWP49096.1 beta-lactamase family protein [Lentzea tibetensis]